MPIEITNWNKSWDSAVPFDISLTVFTFLSFISLASLRIVPNGIRIKMISVFRVNFHFQEFLD